MTRGLDNQPFAVLHLVSLGLITLVFFPGMHLVQYTFKLDLRPMAVLNGCSVTLAPGVAQCRSVQSVSVWPNKRPVWAQ